MGTNKAIDELMNWEKASHEGLYPLPPSLYTSPELLDLEIENIFKKKWLCVGHISELTNPGDYLTFDVIGEPILVVCDNDNNIRAYANVCQHRSAIIASGKGKRSSFVCPYHSWSYDLNGCLRAAPCMNMEKKNLEGVKLPEYRVEVWQSLVFVSLNPDVEPLAPLLEELEPRVNPLNHDTYKVAIREDAELACNWKVLVENFCESYHVMTVHKNTLEPGHPTSTIKFWGEGGSPGGPGFNHHTNLHVDDMTVDDKYVNNGEIDYKRLEGQWEKLLHLVCIYPSFVWVADATFSGWLSIRPTGPQSLKYTMEFALIPSDENSDENGNFKEEAVEGLRGFATTFMNEDKAVIEGVQRGLAAAKGSSFVLNPWEETNVEFGRYLAGQLKKAS